MESNDFLSAALEDDDNRRIIERDRQMTECFRRLFSTHDGRIVLHQILTDLRFYDECVSDTDVALNNFAKFMIFNRLKVDNKKQITNLLMEIKE